LQERGKRKITYPQFRLALQMMAEKKGVSLRHLEQELSACSGPINMTSATVDQDYILQKMTDTRLYTGAHKVSGFSTTGLELSTHVFVQQSIYAERRGATTRESLHARRMLRTAERSKERLLHWNALHHHR